MLVSRDGFALTVCFIYIQGRVLTLQIVNKDEDLNPVALTACDLEQFIV